MDKFAKGRELKELVANKNNQQDQIHQLQQSMMGVFQKLYQFEQTLQGAKAATGALDFRTRAISTLLTKAGISLEDIKNEVFVLQTQQFDADSARDDVTNNLVNADDQVAVNGLHAVTTIKVFKAGVEVEDQRVVRSKVELGKGEFLPEIDAAILGMKVGETKRFPLNLQDRTDEAELTLLGLRQSAPVVAPTTAEVEASSQSQATN